MNVVPMRAKIKNAARHSSLSCELTFPPVVVKNVKGFILFVDPRHVHPFRLELSLLRLCEYLFAHLWRILTIYLH